MVGQYYIAQQNIIRAWKLAGVIIYAYNFKLAIIACYECTLVCLFHMSAGCCCCYSPPEKDMKEDQGVSSSLIFSVLYGRLGSLFGLLFVVQVLILFSLYVKCWYIVCLADVSSSLSAAIRITLYASDEKKKNRGGSFFLVITTMRWIDIYIITPSILNTFVRFEAAWRSSGAITTLGLQLEILWLMIITHIEFWIAPAYLHISDKSLLYPARGS